MTLFLGEVRVGKMFNTSVNQCVHENYSLSPLLPDDVGDGGHFTCGLGKTALARFNVIIMAGKSILSSDCVAFDILETKLLLQLILHKPLHSSKVTIVR